MRGDGRVAFIILEVDLAHTEQSDAVHVENREDAPGGFRSDRTVQAKGLFLQCDPIHAKIHSRHDLTSLSARYSISITTGILKLQQSIQLFLISSLDFFIIKGVKGNSLSVHLEWKCEWFCSIENSLLHLPKKSTQR